MRVVAKPVEIDAWEWTGKRSDIPLHLWSTDLLYVNDADQLVVRTKRGPTITHVGDQVIYGRSRELYPIDAPTFHDKYARMNGDAVAREISAELGINVTYETLRSWFDSVPLIGNGA